GQHRCARQERGQTGGAMCEPRSAAVGAAVATANGGLLGMLLRGMPDRPTGGQQLGEAAQRPARLELADGGEQVDVGVDAEDEAAIDQGEDGRQPLASAGGAGEEEIAAGYGKGPNAPLGAAVVDLEAPVLEAATEE